MKISRNGPIPQLELGPHLGSFKVLYQRSGVVMRTITLVAALTSAWSTTPPLRSFFLDSSALYFGAVLLVGLLWMVVDYTAILPSEQSFRQGQSQRSERSPLKQDTERILNRLDQRAVADGGTTVVAPGCAECNRTGVKDTHKSETVISCPNCGDILYREV